MIDMKVKPTILSARRALLWLVCASMLIIVAVGHSTAGTAESTCGYGYACVVKEVSGDVWWCKPHSSGDCSKQPLKAGMMLRPGCRITTDNDGLALLTLADGTTVSVGRDTDLIVGPVGLEQVEQGESSLAAPQIRMFLGKVWLEVTKRFQLGPGFEVETPSSTIAVRGTAFDIEVDEEGITYIWVDSGEVIVENEEGSIAVKPGQSAKAKKGLPPEAAEPARARNSQRPGSAGKPHNSSNSGNSGQSNKPHPHQGGEWPPGKDKGNKNPDWIPPGQKKSGRE